MVGSRSKFAETTCAAHKGKAVIGATGPFPKHVRQAEKVIMLPPPPQLTIEDLSHSQLESSAMGASVSVLVF